MRPGDKAIKRPPSLLRSSGVVGAMTMISRVLGLARDMVIANLFGASAGADAFFVAFKIPNFMRRLFAEGAFSQAFIPVLSEYKTRYTLEEVRRLVSRVGGTLGLVLLAVTLLGVAGADVLAFLFAPGFSDDAEKLALTVELLRLTFPYLFLISMTAFAGSVLNSYGYFAIPAITPVLLNISLIMSAIFLSASMDEPIAALAWGVLIAGVAQLLFQLPFLRRIGLLPAPMLDIRHEGVRRIGRLMLPALFGVSVSQINLLLDTVLASFLQTGSVSWLYYSDRLTELPLGVFGIAVATVILPSLSSRHASNSTVEFSRTLDWGVRTVLIIALPATLALTWLAEPLIATLFQHGALTDYDVLQSSRSLQAYAMGLPFFMLIKVLAPGFFSRQDIRTPVKIGIIAMVANMIMNLMLILPLAHVGLAAATSLSGALNAGFLWYTLHKQGVYHRQQGWGLFFLKLLAALIGLGLLLFLATPDDAFWYSANWYAKGGWMLGIAGAGVAIYFALLYLMGFRLSQYLHSQ
ncbi:murein biosynthesis integral membrane protein MurJ [Allohahella marinimesophila]|uniref:Probable lipid II flippase MurJ n=1 Tax=Allohahella marinimesophila TaxID=1054972 RepID=A0ABP7PTG8_9GAMM